MSLSFISVTFLCVCLPFFGAAVRLSSHFRDDSAAEVDAPGSGNGAGSAIVGNGNGMVSSSSTMFVNNGCVYQNGMISENGGPARPATEAEKAQVRAHMAAMERAQQQFQNDMADSMRAMQQSMQQMFAPPFPFGSNRDSPAPPHMPPVPPMKMPEFPCFCANGCGQQGGGNHYSQQFSSGGASSGVVGGTNGQRDFFTA